MRKIRFAAVLILAACGKPVEPRITGQVQMPSPVEVWLAVGGSVVADSTIRVTFVGVPADSRCPSDVTCVWEGDAAVAITAQLGGSTEVHDTLHTSLTPQNIQVGNYVITLLLVGPDPINSNPIPADEYAARLRIVQHR